MQYFDFIILAMGVYTMVSAILLKTRGRISNQIMKSPNKDTKHIKDMDGFRNFIFPRCLIVGIVVTVLSCLDLAIDYSLGPFNSSSSGILQTVCITIVVVILFWYAHELHVAEKRFYD